MLLLRDFEEVLVGAERNGVSDGCEHGRVTDAVTDSVTFPIARAVFGNKQVESGLFIEYGRGGFTGETSIRAYQGAAYGVIEAMVARQEFDDFPR